MRKFLKHEKFDIRQIMEMMFKYQAENSFFGKICAEFNLSWNRFQLKNWHGYLIATKTFRTIKKKFNEFSYQEPKN